MRVVGRSPARALVVALVASAALEDRDADTGDPSYRDRLPPQVL